MTIYLFIDLPFNEIGCYPTSLRDEEREGESERGEGKSRAAINGATNFLFLSLASLRLGFSPTVRVQGHMSDPMGCIQARVLFHIYHLISPRSLHTLSSDLII